MRGRGGIAFGLIAFNERTFARSRFFTPAIGFGGSGGARFIGAAFDDFYLHRTRTSPCGATCRRTTANGKFATAQTQSFVFTLFAHIITHIIAHIITHWAVLHPKRPK